MRACPRPQKPPLKGEVSRRDEGFRSPSPKSLREDSRPEAAGEYSHKLHLPIPRITANILPPSAEGGEPPTGRWVVEDKLTRWGIL